MNKRLIGDLIAIAEVVRDLHRNDDQREQSYSERQLYEAALERLTREVAAVADNSRRAKKWMLFWCLALLKPDLKLKNRAFFLQVSYVILASRVQICALRM